ncbi:MAG: MotA/TolQ/ExbB proton channel family protein [Planctomycetaceae bacterium]
MSERHDVAEPAGLRGLWTAALLSPWVWGGGLTVAFYQLVPDLPVQQPLIERYFCGHPIEYVTAALFFVGLAALALKWRQLRWERRSLAAGPVSLKPKMPNDAIARQINELSPGLRRTHLVQRIADANEFVRDRGSAEGLEDHLRYLAELAAERAHAGLALVRTITWAIPILGFLGTVVGITMAIANLTPDQLDTSLSSVTSGLAVAFDTTALSLALTLVLVFCMFRIERGEQQVLARVEQYGLRRLAPMFPTPPGRELPLAKAQHDAARKLLEKTDAVLAKQMELWQEALDALRRRWIESMDQQTRDMDRVLQTSLQATLEELRTQTSVLEKLSDQEVRLAKLQARLAENLDAVRNAAAFDETLHSLNAAVHLLTARTGKAA